MLVTELAKAHSAKVADTIHDLRQPLQALRHKVTGLAKTQTADDTEAARINETFAYMEELLANELQGALTSEDRLARDAAARRNENALPGVQETLRLVHDMFVDNARSKGLDLRLAKGGGEGEVNPLVLMRIVSNLVSNAIRYTPEGKVLIGSRLRSGRIRIEVHDTGPGLSSDEFDFAKQRAARLERDHLAAEGDGLGLAIVCDLAAQNGMDVRLLPCRHRGTSIAVEVGCPARLA